MHCCLPVASDSPSETHHTNIHVHVLHHECKKLTLKNSLDSLRNGFSKSSSYTSLFPIPSAINILHVLFTARLVVRYMHDRVGGGRVGGRKGGSKMMNVQCTRKY